jgi:hypothetical protein
MHARPFYKAEAVMERRNLLLTPTALVLVANSIAMIFKNKFLEMAKL